MSEGGDGPKFEPVVVIFKPKDKRAYPSLDKQDVIRQVLSGRRRDDVQFFEASTKSLGAAPPAVDAHLTAFDVNRFETPIVCVHLTVDERAALEDHPDIELIEDDDDFVYSHAGPFHPLRVQGQPPLDTETIPAGVAQINAPAAWGNSQGKGIRVAVLDTGIDDSHPDLAANVMGGVTFVSGTPTWRDDEGHGTFCAGIVAAAISGAGIVGVAPQASLYAVKVSDQTGAPTLRSIIAGLDWCIANHMHVINMSFGFSEPRMSLYLMCRKAWESGALLVASVGNDSSKTVTYPAAFDTVIGVAAIDSKNAHYPQSNTGSGVNICAPGVNVLSTGLRGSYQTMSGTSAACPHVAGAAALAWGAHRFAENKEIWHLLASTARGLGDEPMFGKGRVNALAASGELVKPRVQLEPIAGRKFDVRRDENGRRAPVEVP